MTDQPLHHEAHLNTSGGHVAFICCGRTDHPFDTFWLAFTDHPGARAAAYFWTPRQAYDMVVRHLTHEQHDDATLAPLLETADALIYTDTRLTEEGMTSRLDEVRPAIQYLADRLDNITLNVRQQ